MRQEERTVIALVHLLIILPLWGILFAGIIWLNFKERSREVVFHSQQAIFFQCIFLLIFVVYLIFLLFCNLIAVFNLQLANLLILGNKVLLVGCGLVYITICIYAAIRVIFGKDFNYPYVGKKLRRLMEE
ncbi:DUF4870 domain-containing protein [Candidatus Sumerlaeota bacterium]|nr:DUF4870 domain-containing protein [Candidatus Sumerlaeota bacterium]